jgi:hypothetical protein
LGANHSPPPKPVQAVAHIISYITDANLKAVKEAVLAQLDVEDFGNRDAGGVEKIGRDVFAAIWNTTESLQLNDVP